MTTPAPEKAAPIPVEVLALRDRLLAEHERLSHALALRKGVHVLHDGDIEKLATLVLDAATLADRASQEDRADREARPSLPNSREERIREDEPGYLVRIAFREGRSGGLRITSPDVPGLILSHHDEPAILADMIEVLRETDRALARQGGNNG